MFTDFLFQGELEHRRVKRFYARTNKRKNFGLQIAKHQRRERLLKQIRERWKDREELQTKAARLDSETLHSPAPNVPFEDSDPLPKTLPEVHYHISNTTRLNDNVFRWVDFHEQNGDDAVKVSSLLMDLLLYLNLTNSFGQDFIPKLKDHILSRLSGCAYDGDEVTFSEAERDSIRFVNNKLYRHKTLRINYTTYDLRRQQDSINPRTHSDVMLLSHEDSDEEIDAHPYWYARVVGIFHVDIIHNGATSTSPEQRRIDFLWVRWFGRDISFNAGWTAQRLHRVGFLNANSESGALGFLDPSVIIRGVHVIPAFAHGKMSDSDLLHPPQSVARVPLGEEYDWRYYYINM